MNEDVTVIISKFERLFVSNLNCSSVQLTTQPSEVSSDTGGDGAGEWLLSSLCSSKKTLPKSKTNVQDFYSVIIVCINL